MKKIIIAIVVLVAAYFAYRHFAGSPAGGGMTGGASPVSVAEVLSREVQEWHDFSGRLVAVNQVEVRPRVSGAIDSVHFNDGQMVKKGDLLFIIDPRPYEAALHAAAARAAYAEAQFARAERLMQDKAIPQSEYDQRKNEAEVARADLAAAQLNLGYTQIRSPISGKASRAEITLGNLVETGGTAPVLTTVVSTTPIYGDFEIDEASFLRYVEHAGGKTGRIPVMMGLGNEEGTPHEGHIAFFDNRLDVASGTIRVRAVFDNKDGMLVPGLFARIRLGSATGTKALLISDKAVGTDQNKQFVYVVGGDNKVEYREVKLGDLADGLRIVESGLKEGEKIVVNGIQRVRPGATVTPQIVPMDKPITDDDGRMTEEKEKAK